MRSHFGAVTVLLVHLALHDFIAHCDASCARDVSKIANDVRGIAADVLKILPDCGRGHCSQDISSIVARLGDAGQDLGVAAKDCAGVSASCSSSIQVLGKAVKDESKHAGEIVRDCGHLSICSCGAALAATALDTPRMLRDVERMLNACVGSIFTRRRRSPPPTSKTWPTFSNQAALSADPWADYYKGVYGELPSSYPVRTEDLWMLYDAELIKAKVTRAPKSVGVCPTANPPLGQRYDINNMYSPQFLSWLWHPYPYRQTAAHSWVEVLHEADPFGDEHFGAWFVHAPGSGIYFNVGRTVSFAEHGDAYKHFGITGGHPNEALSRAAAGQGYDSIQFLAHVDHVNYECDTHNTGKPGLKY